MGTKWDPLSIFLILIVATRDLCIAHPYLYTARGRHGYGRNIQPRECVTGGGDTGICMFAWDCMKANGTHLGTCIDRFYFGSCCKLHGDTVPVVHPGDVTSGIDTINSVTDNNLSNGDGVGAPASEIDEEIISDGGLEGGQTEMENENNQLTGEEVVNPVDTGIGGGEGLTPGSELEQGQTELEDGNTELTGGEVIIDPIVTETEETEQDMEGQNTSEPGLEGTGIDTGVDGGVTDSEGPTEVKVPVDEQGNEDENGEEIIGQDEITSGTMEGNQDGVEGGDTMGTDGLTDGTNQEGGTNPTDEEISDNNENTEGEIQIEEIFENEGSSENENQGSGTGTGTGDGTTDGSDSGQTSGGDGEMEPDVIEQDVETGDSVNTGEAPVIGTETEESEQLGGGMSDLDNTSDNTNIEENETTDEGTTETEDHTGTDSDGQVDESTMITDQPDSDPNIISIVPASSIFEDGNNGDTMTTGGIDNNQGNDGSTDDVEGGLEVFPATDSGNEETIENNEDNLSSSEDQTNPTGQVGIQFPGEDDNDNIGSDNEGNNNENENFDNNMDNETTDNDSNISPVQEEELDSDLPSTENPMIIDGSDQDMDLKMPTENESSEMAGSDNTDEQNPESQTDVEETTILDLDTITGSDVDSIHISGPTSDKEDESTDILFPTDLEIETVTEIFEDSSETETSSVESQSNSSISESTSMNPSSIPIQSTTQQTTSIDQSISTTSSSSVGTSTSETDFDSINVSGGDTMTTFSPEMSSNDTVTLDPSSTNIDTSLGSTELPSLTPSTSTDEGGAISVTTSGTEQSTETSEITSIQTTHISNTSTTSESSSTSEGVLSNESTTSVPINLIIPGLGTVDPVDISYNDTDQSLQNETGPVIGIKPISSAGVNASSASGPMTEQSTGFPVTDSPAISTEINTEIATPDKTDSITSSSTTSSAVTPTSSEATPSPSSSISSTNLPTTIQEPVVEQNETTSNGSVTIIFPTGGASTQSSLNVTGDSSEEIPEIPPTTLSPEDEIILDLNSRNYSDICGKPQVPTKRIVGGTEAEFAQWPWQLSLRQWRTVTFLHKCGAALVNQNWAITAAHCVENVEPEDLLLRLGEYDLERTDEDYQYVERNVQLVAAHPQFDSRTFEYDLALIRFVKPIQFQPNIIPICIPDNDYDFINNTGYVTGWGRLYEEGPLPSVLQNVPVPVIPNAECEGMYRMAGFVEHIPNIFICAGYAEGKRDSCEGDSGGPMVIYNEGRWKLAGIISWGIGCALPNQPGVYTRISEFRNWINTIIQF